MITQILTAHLERNQEAVAKIKQAVISARAKGMRSPAESLELGEKVASLDDTEGVGPLHVTYRKAIR